MRTNQNSAGGHISVHFTVKKLVAMWVDEDDGGFNDNLFELFTRFKKDEVKQLASLLDVPTAFAIDKLGVVKKARRTSSNSIFQVTGCLAEK